MGISILALFVAQEALVLLLLDDSPYVSAGSFVALVSIDKIPTISCISVGIMGIPMVTTSAI